MLPSGGLVAVLATVLMVTGAQEMKILPYGDTHTKALGENIVFTCSTSGLGGPNVDPDLKWFNDEGFEITETTGRIYLETAGVQALKLYITTIQNSDAGNYKCTADLNGTPTEKSVVLDIFKDITFDHAPSPQALEIFTDALIECKVSGQPIPTVSWRYNGDTIITGGRFIQEQDGLRILNITQSDDDFDYLCRAEVESDGRYDQRAISVEVHIPPSMSSPMGTQEGIAGQEISLKCEANGEPSPKYEFYKDGADNPVLPDNRIEVDRDAGFVHFRPLIKADEGNYKCKASNDVGNAEDEGFLRVLVPPKIETLINQTAEEGQSQQLTCIAQGDPAPSMTFRKMGNDYEYELGDNEGGKVVLDNPVDGTLVMTVKNLSPEDTDNYTCIAVNSAGDHKQNGSLVVHYIPRFAEDHPKEFYLWAGKTRNVTCFSQSEPEPAIKWYKDGRELPNNETYRIYNMKKNSNLQITCREEDQGWIYGLYQCEASNQIGTGDIQLDVIRAVLPGAPASASVREESPTMITLDVAPPENDGGIPISGYRVEYDNNLREVALADTAENVTSAPEAPYNVEVIDTALADSGKPVVIENLSPGTTYYFRLRAKNEVGVGPALDYTHHTESIRAPYPLVLKQKEGDMAYEYVLEWEKPRTGGLPIDEYEFKIRKVTLKNDGTVDEPLEDWVRSLRDDSPANPRTSYEFKNLSPDASYQVETRARNSVGYSLYNPEFVFKTVQGEGPAPAVKSGGLDTGAVIGIVIVVFLLFLVIVDVSCYFMNGCGILMCICVNLCGKPKHVNKEKSMEEGESKEALKAPVEEAIVAQEQEVVSETPPEKEPPADDVEEPPSDQPDEDEKKPLSQEGGMEELEPEDKEEIVEETNPPSDKPEIVREEDVEIEADEKTPLNEDPKEPETKTETETKEKEPAPPEQKE